MIGDLKSLELLVLDSNYLSGTVPEEVAQLTNIEAFDVNHNDLTGAVLELAVQLPKVVDINIGRNKFTGTIPENIGDAVPNLRAFVADETLLSGSIPASFTKLTALDQIIISSGNVFDATIPEDVWKLSHLGMYAQQRVLHTIARRFLHFFVQFPQRSSPSSAAKAMERFRPPLASSVSWKS